MMASPATVVRQTTSQCILLAVIISSIFVATVRAQTSGATLGHTPSGLTPGSPAGSYALSGFDTINPYNGGLNFSLPLLNAGGRGAAGYTIPVQIEQKWTAFHDVIIDPQTNQQWDFWWPEYNWWTGLKPGYTPGVLQGRQAGVGSQTCTTGGTWSTYLHTLTRLTFTTPDGTEFELRDQLTGGQRATVPYCTLIDTPGASRGTVFVTADGSSATFVSDTTIYDDITIANNVIYPSGFLMLRDGTRYRIVDGSVTWMRDRNGNRLTFAAAVGAMTITDSLNRQISIEYDIQDIAPYGLCDRITFKGFGGASRVIRVSKTNLGSALRSDFSLQSPISLFPELFSGSSGPHDPTVTSAVWLPNGQSYKLFYNSYGELARVELPTGGAFEYDWAAGATGGPTSGVICPLSNDPHIYRRIIERREYPEGGMGSTYATRMTYSRPEGTTSNCPSSNEGYVEVSQFNNTGTLLARTRHFYFGSPTASLINSYDPTTYPSWDEGKEYQTEVFDSNGTTVLRRVVNTWQGNGTMGGLTVNPRITQKTTAIEPSGSNLVAKQSFAHDQYNNQTDVYEYDFGTGGPGSLVRRTHIDYLTTNPVNGVNYATTNTIHLRNGATQNSIYDAAGGEKARTTFEYDNYISDANHGPLVNRLMISGFDGSFTTSYTTRGNVTRVSAWLLPAGSSIPVYSQYDIAGNVVKTIDGRGYATEFDFTDRYGSPDGEARLNSAPLELSSQGQASYAFPTKVTNALGHTAYSQFDYYLGKPIDAEDTNQVNSSGYFDDPLDRPKRIIRAVNNPTIKSQTTFTYNDVNRVVTSTSDLNTYDDNSLKSETLYDGFGRTIETRQYEGGTNYIAVKQIPFVMQQDPDTSAWVRATQLSNSYRPYLGEQPVWTTNFFDALDRMVKARTPDNAIVRTVSLGNQVTVTDQAGKARKNVTDALGRLTSVYEDPSGLNYLTSYTYDVLDNLTNVTQGMQTRTFVYDSLKRLSSAINPESGTIGYLYDANGNLTKKTDGRGIYIDYLYDALNRNTTKNYSDVTPDVTYTYDAVGVANSKGRLTLVSSSVSATNYTAYDVLGRMTAGNQITDGQTYSMSYGYNLAGNQTSITYPSGRVIETKYDVAGRMAGVKDQQSGVYYAGAVESDATNRIQYAPHGAVKVMRLGNGQWEHTDFNNRLQATQIGLGTSSTDSSTIGLTYNYGTTNNNGNVQTITYAGGGLSYTQTFGYDQLNRLTTSVESGASWSQTNSYDPYGNRSIVGGGLSFSATNNRITNAGYVYDSAGNLINDGTQSFAFDADNKIKTVNGENDVYRYDGDGNRVKKNFTLGEKVRMVYGGGQLLAEYDLSNGSLKKEYVHGAKGLIATIEPTNGTRYTTADHLGTPRVVTTSSAGVVSRHDYKPFGEEIGAGIGGRTTGMGFSVSDGLRQKFTLKERDNETGLDYFLARYYSSTQGRFTSVDPANAGAEPSNPQSWNGYAYAFNNPVKYQDPDGLKVRVCDTAGNCTDDKTDLSDEQWNKLFGGDKSIKLQGGNVFKNGEFIGTYQQQSCDSCLYDIHALGRQITASDPGGKAVKLWAGSVVAGVTGGTAYYFAAPFLAPTVTTLALRSAPLLPVVPSAIDKLQKLGISVEQANAIVRSPASQKLIDNANGGNINVIQEVGGKLVRVTTDPTGQRIISAGIVRANSITNGIANGRFTPKK